MISKTTELRLIARTHTRSALAVLIGIARSNASPCTARIAAAVALLDRGWGRPAQMLTTEDGSPVGLRITEIVNTIVDPKVNDGAPMRLRQTGAVVQLKATDEVPGDAVADSDETSDAQ